jgi:hypothetical protein
MARWTNIIYRDFYDVPRIFLATDGSRLILFDCAFDESRDEYAEKYSVYEMPELQHDILSGTWDRLADYATRCLGWVPTSLVEFDETRRKMVNLDVLGAIVRA